MTQLIVIEGDKMIENREISADMKRSIVAANDNLEFNKDLPNQWNKMLEYQELIRILSKMYNSTHFEQR